MTCCHSKSNERPSALADEKNSQGAKNNNNNNNNNNTNWNRCTRYSHKRIGKMSGGIENKRTSGDHPKYNIIKIGHNTEISPGNSRRLAVTQTPVNDHQLMLV